MKKDETGFSTVEIILIIIVVALIGAVGWLVYKNQSKSTKNTSSSPSSIATSPASTMKTTPASPYAGWQSYCSSLGGICLKYPTDWKLDTKTYTASESPSPEVNTLANSSGNVTVNYIPSEGIAGTGTPETMFVADAAKAQSDGLYVVSLVDKQKGGNTYTIESFVTNTLDRSDGTKFTKGASIDSAYENVIRRFKPAGNSNISTQLNIVDKHGSFSSKEAALAEISSADYQTALKILVSASYK